MSQLPTLRQLQYFITLVETRHFGRAAERCFVTQSTLSSAIKDLEETLGTELFERTRRKVLPTPTALSLAAEARIILEHVEGLVDMVRARDAPLSGSLRLGTIPTIGPFVLPKVLKGLRRAYPELKLYLRDGLTRELLDQLRNGELEAALIALPFEVDEFEVLSLGHDPLWFAAPADHPLMRSRKRTVAPEDVDPAEVLLLEDGHCLREHALYACRMNPGQGTAGYQTSSLYALIEMVANGLGVTFLPELGLSGGIARSADIAVKPLGRDSQPREIALVSRKVFHREGDIAALGTYLRGRMATMRYSAPGKAS